MKFRISYIILFLFAFIFPSIAQDSYIDYEYVDGTKEREAISSDRMECRYTFDKGSSYIISSIFIFNVFEPKKGDLYYSCLGVSFKNGELSSATGPRSYTSMGDFNPFQYDLKLGKIDSNKGIMTVCFKSKDTNPTTSRHNGKQIKSISGCISYSRLKIIPSTILNEELKDNLKPFYLDTTRLTGNSYCSYIKFISPSYDENAKKINMNDLSLERVAVINNLKRMGYTLTSAKGVFPLTYQDKDGNKILMYETYIMVVITD
ncbi:MAG: hypothetical protein UH850_05480 [Paludibacteraceae bacterium]|nr:hypothetical protein [Paludibacteraceae bacterium]